MQSVDLGFPKYRLKPCTIFKKNYPSLISRKYRNLTCQRLGLYLYLENWLYISNLHFLFQLVQVPIKQLETPRLHEHWASLYLKNSSGYISAHSLPHRQNCKQQMNFQIDGQAPKFRLPEINLSSWCMKHPLRRRFIFHQSVPPWSREASHI